MEYEKLCECVDFWVDVNNKAYEIVDEETLYQLFSTNHMPYLSFLGRIEHSIALS